MTAKEGKTHSLWSLFYGKVMRQFFKENQAFWGDVFRFCVAGALSVATQYFVLITLVEVFHLNPTFSSATGFISGCVVNYLLLYFWAFTSSARHHIALLRYVTVMSGSMTINVVIFWALTERVGMWYPVSQFFATCSSSCFSFLANRSFTFVD